MHELKYQFKILMRSKMLIFWSMIFPLCLASFFKLAFSDLLSNEKFEAFDIAYVSQGDNLEFKSIIEHMSQNNDEQMFHVKYTTQDEAKELLKKEKIKGYYVVDEDIDVYINSEDIDETIMTTVAHSYKQASSTMKRIYQEKPEVFYNGLIQTINLQNNYFKEEKINNLDMTVIYFYTLIGMSCITGGTWSITVTSQKEGNLSRQGTRLCISPTSKMKSLWVGLLSAFIIHYIECIVLLLYMIFVLNVGFGSQVGYILLLEAAGSFVGITLGNLVSHLLKTSKESKISVFTSVTMIFSFLAGMMGSTDIKYLIQTHLPILANINPVNLITDGLYALYYFPTLDRFYSNFIYLMIMGIVVSFISLFFMRRKQYDHI